MGIEGGPSKSGPQNEPKKIDKEKSPFTVNPDGSVTISGQEWRSERTTEDIKKVLEQKYDKDKNLKTGFQFSNNETLEGTETKEVKKNDETIEEAYDWATDR